MGGGVIGHREFLMARAIDPKQSLESIVNRDCKVIIENDLVDDYMQARDIYAESKLEYLPVISKGGDIIDILSKRRVFYKKYFEEGTLPRMHYAVCIMAAARMAQERGLQSISILEFGVAEGNGLLDAQFHAREIGRILGIEIEVYGFDLGDGLPKSEENIDDMVHIFVEGAYKMDYSNLRERLLENTSLILGDIKETLPQFIDKYSPAVIGAVFIDVDYYSSTKHILEWLADYPDKKMFLPRIPMYFDDISDLYEGIGEAKAIREFNLKNENRMGIFPENNTDNLDWLDIIYGVKSEWIRYGNDYGHSRVKLCHRFLDKDYDTCYNPPSKEEAKILRSLLDTHEL